MVCTWSWYGVDSRTVLWLWFNSTGTAPGLSLLLLTQASRLGVGKRWKGYTARKLSWTGHRGIAYHMASCSAIKPQHRTSVCGGVNLLFVFLSKRYTYWGPASYEVADKKQRKWFLLLLLPCSLRLLIFLASISFFPPPIPTALLLGKRSKRAAVRSLAAWQW